MALHKQRALHYFRCQLLKTPQDSIAESCCPATGTPAPPKRVNLQKGVNFCVSTFAIAELYLACGMSYVGLCIQHDANHGHCFRGQLLKIYLRNCSN